MGRKIRRVPPNWEHPKQSDGRCYKPLFDESFDDAMQRWLDELETWKQGERERVIKEYGEPYASMGIMEGFAHWHGGPPDPASYRPAWPAGAATWYQVYENVSEGTPITPAFATKEELVEHLVSHGDGWDRPVSREAVERFVQNGYAPSMVIDERGITVGIETLGERR